MLTIKLDSPIPLSEQIRLGIRQAIATGELKPGDPLPVVRQLANDLDINFNTVARAYKELEQEGLVRSIRGRGTVVTSTNEKSRESKPVIKTNLSAKIRDILTEAQLLGLSKESVEKMIQNELKLFWSQGDSENE